ncbi:hypothetical protein CTEN210_13640 [Chaetoceros tenuissimus]|uniref:Uncharacterized protein n=1 Tax=Chaetoceros tenuissimus TaxID=426638 RepID=A0AAD3D709_9STRA|nr:hypothetical protein CTEN210_13640 [Chaetoceros tenuissimus]
MNISTFQANLDFIKILYFHEEWKDEECRDDILKAIEECNDKIEEAFGRSMHRLHRHQPTVDAIDFHFYLKMPSIEAVEKVVKKFPSVLSYEDEDEDGHFPIQTAAITDGFQYVPILAKEGMKHKVGGEDARGGLLKVAKNGCNTLQYLALFQDDEGDSTERVDVFKQLQRSGLLKKTDVQDQKMLFYSCSYETKLRFEYLVNWVPDALIETTVKVTRTRYAPLIHAMSLQSEERLIFALEAGFRHCPQIGGLLFIKDYKGSTALDCLCNEKGVEEVVSLLHQILTPNCDYPILHHIFVKAPQHYTIFMKKFPWAYHLKDHNGRTLQQAVLAAGPDIINANDILLATLSDDQIQTKDPITTFYPFAAMAVGKKADLEQSFYLLRRQPSVLDRHSRVRKTRRRKRRNLSRK